MAKKQPALTPWFPVSLAPGREGVYQVRSLLSRFQFWSLWSDGAWHGTTHNIHNAEAFGLRFGITYVDLTEWRGLAKEPK